MRRGIASLWHVPRWRRQHERCGQSRYAPRTFHHSRPFKDLVGSDHAEFKLFDASDALSMQFKLDYISEVPTAPSGYATLGVTGGEGEMIVGAASDVMAASSSLARNLNACMLGSYLTDSPATDASYAPNADAGAWDYRVVYDVWVKRSAFGASGFGRGTVEFVHASPSKLGENTIATAVRGMGGVWLPSLRKSAHESVRFLQQ